MTMPISNICVLLICVRLGTTPSWSMSTLVTAILMAVALPLLWVNVASMYYVLLPFNVRCSVTYIIRACLRVQYLFQMQTPLPHSVAMLPRVSQWLVACYQGGRDVSTIGAPLFMKGRKPELCQCENDRRRSPKLSPSADVHCKHVALYLILDWDGITDNVECKYRSGGDQYPQARRVLSNLTCFTYTAQRSCLDLKSCAYSCYYSTYSSTDASTVLHASSSSGMRSHTVQGSHILEILIPLLLVLRSYPLCSEHRDKG